MLLVAVCAWAYTAHSSGGQEQNADRMIEKGEDYNPPVKIRLVKSKIGVIEPGKKISADDDWLRGLTVRVSNASNKPVTSVSLAIQFRRPENQPRELDLIAPIEYGRNPFAPSQESTIAPPEPIFPGQTRDITLSDEGYDSLRSILDNLNFPLSIKSVKLQVRTVGFSDGTAWNTGKTFRRDPDNPDKWIRENPSQAHAKKKATLFTEAAFIAKSAMLDDETHVCE
jgi:hypothetical protein